MGVSEDGTNLDETKAGEPVSVVPRDVNGLPITSQHFINRELSWLEFNSRVLEEARDKKNPLLERVKFWCIFSSNLDEFFEVRVAGLKQQIEGHVVGQGADGMAPRDTLKAVTKRIRLLVAEQYRCWNKELRPLLAKHGIHFRSLSELTETDRQWVQEYYHDEVRPVLTPLSLDPSHPFPQLLNKSLNLIVQLDFEQPGMPKERLSVVQAPRVLPRLLALPGGAEERREYVFLADVIGQFLADLFPGATIRGFWPFRLTRNSELYIDEEDVDNLLRAVEKELRNRRRGSAVRLEVESDCPDPIRRRLLRFTRLKEEDLYAVDGPINSTRLMTIYAGNHNPELRDPPFDGPIARSLRGVEDLFESIQKRDRLLHHPYECFESVIDFVEQAAEDPSVLAIKQTLYRTGGDRRIVGALMKAVENGKQVTAVVELKARFDEANNIEWSKRLEEAGVHVVYGIVGLKIHCKMCLVVRREADGIRRYLHLGTGNYNASTARLYTDLGLLTCDPQFGEDATNLFNLLTGVCRFPGMSRLLVAPYDLHRRMLELIDKERENAAKGLPARIIAKMNSLVDPDIIRALYRASAAGVRVDLIVRGVCCLRPGIPGLSERIHVRSIVGRFLEHTRIFYFENGCRPKVFVGSADWMPRNFFRRIEVLFPVLDGRLREEIATHILPVSLEDTAKARILNSDGRYHRPKVGRKTAAVNSQVRFMDLARGKGPGRRRRNPAADPSVAPVLRERPSAR